MSTAQHAPADFTDPRLYVNRDLSLLQFQWRVLEEGKDARNPLLERARFLSILSSNLDEFFMVRVAGFHQQMAAGVQEGGNDGISVSNLLHQIRAEVGRLLGEAYRFYREDLLPSLAAHRIEIRSYRDLSPAQKAQADQYFLDSVFPVLTPLAFDPGRPFPHISNLSLNLAVLVKGVGGGEERFARVKVPDTLSQLVHLSDPQPTGQEPVHCFLWLDELIAANLGSLFPGVEVMSAHAFHVTRDAEVAIQELEAEDLLETIEEAMWERRFRAVVRLQVPNDMPAALLEILTSNLEVKPEDVYRVEGPLDLGRLKYLNVDRPDLRFKPFVPQTPVGLQDKEDDFFELIKQGDILLHHPYDSFQPVIELLRRAAKDPDVLAIKMTLYRVGRNSPVVEALLEAIENGKQVAVLVELKARFDEESNIEWARALEREGVHVIYGLLGLKVHSKVALVVRREGDQIRRYLHLATGNYNPGTARAYTDLGVFTADPDMGADVSDLFNFLTGYSAKKEFRKLLVAPINLRQHMEDLIRREIEHQHQGRVGHLVFKMNALEDMPIIQMLYRASQAGVKVELLVRGICCLRPGIPGVSENITVTSIVGQFLEHSRIYWFRNGGQQQVYLGSADLMPRNINRRVEVLFPVQPPEMVRRIRDEILATYLSDTARARLMRADGTYHRVELGEGVMPVSAQSMFLSQAGSLRRPC